MLKDGQIVEQGKHDELMAANGLYHSTYTAQLEASEDLQESLRED
jgi:ABC-type multidrug transport system fused ATPase/permease subunit